MREYVGHEPSLGLSSFCLFILSNSDMLVFVSSSYFILFCFIVIPQKPICFLVKDRELWIEGMVGGVEGGGALWEKKSIFNKREDKGKKIKEPVKEERLSHMNSIFRKCQGSLGRELSW